ncbi:MAG: GMC family oxidoreductase [Hyphomicrobiaceae bacterium]
MTEPLETYDYIIVGGGTAGCLLANRLSQMTPAVRVLMIEAGGTDDWLWLKIPVGYLYCHGNPRVDWCFETAPEPGLNGRSLGYPRGKVLGGCSSVNGMIYMRGQARDYDLWRQMGCEGWSWSDVLPYFLRHEDQWAMSKDDFDGLHARGGEWRIERPRVRWEILEAWAQAAEQVGIPRIKDFNKGNNEGSAYFQVNQRRGVRWNTTRAFLHTAMKRDNLSVLTNAMVERLVVENGRVTGIDVRRRQFTLRIGARREVVLAAGAIGTPQLMQLSGIGPGERLQRLGINVVHAMDGVGENLQDHLQIRCAYKVNGIETLNERSQTALQKAMIGLEYVFRRTGPLTMAPSQLGTFAKSDTTRETPNLQYHVQPLTLPKFGEPLDPFPAFTASVCNLRPTSRGFVSITSPDPDNKPMIQPNYLTTDEDRRVAADAIRLTRLIVAQPALAPYHPEEFRPGPEVGNDDEALAKAAGDIGTTIFHPVGTARMGPQDDPTAVVGPRLKVHGLEGLRVADASVMPTITSGNTASPTLMIAEKCAAMIIEDWKG